MTSDPTNDSHTVFSQVDIERIQAETSIQQVEFRRDLASTNDLALEIANQEGSRFPLLVLAEKQTAGRGRRANRWWSTAGALTFSLLLKTDPDKLPPARWPQASLTIGLAICETLEELLEDAEILLKWPNDVYVEGRKISGVLVESPSRQPDKLVLGIGINVNNSLSTAPDEISSSATALCDIAGREFSLVDVLIRVLNKLAERLDWIGLHDQKLRERWRERCLLTDRRVQIDSEAGQIVGVCQGIDDEGALILHTDTGRQRCLAGTVTLLDGKNYTNPV